MSEEQYRKAVVTILLTAVKMMSIFIRAWADSQYKIIFDPYRDEAQQTYRQLEDKVAHILKE